MTIVSFDGLSTKKEWTPVPEKKVTAATLAGAVVTILVWILHLTGVDIPSEVAAAITTVLAAVAGYMAPHTHRPDLAEPVARRSTASTS
ncbi:MAG: hypothetical protein JWP48_6451 [Actinoallomurus sp.]|jgi:hypothetical protein|nr:hypothetical protein [Actinoallomurus sp.]